MVPSLQALLSQYAEMLTPWAERAAAKMLGEVNDRDREAWRSLGNAISAGLRDTILSAPVGGTMQKLLGEQVTLIKSIPLEAGQRVHELTLKGLENSTRAKEIGAAIARSGEVAESGAMRIARTEVSRTSSVLVQARAEYAGSPGYIWRTSRGGNVRPGHRKMEGQYCEWAHPPAVNEGGRIMHFHPGCIWECQCYPEPVLSDQ